MVIDNSQFTRLEDNVKVKEKEREDVINEKAKVSKAYGPNPFTKKDFDNHHPAVIVREFIPIKKQNHHSSSASDNWQQPWELKAAEIEARTRELEKREAQLGQTNRMTEPMKNFPPFFPLTYHDIEADLSNECQDVAKRSFFIWQLTAGAYALNFIAEIAMLFSGLSGYSSLSGTVFAAIYMVFFPALAFFSWHRSLYQALKYDSSIWYVGYFVSFGLQVVFYVFLGIGLFNGGGGGLLGMLEMFSHGKLIAGIMSAICTAAIALCFLMSLALIKQVNDKFRNNGHSVGRAGADAGRTFAQNETFKKTAKEAIINNV